MRTKVTENGVLIPKGWLEGIDEVDIQKTQNMILVVPVQADDPILNQGGGKESVPAFDGVFLDPRDAAKNVFQVDAVVFHKGRASAKMRARAT